MEWSPQQEKALKGIAAWLKDPTGPQVRRLFGFAGTGKSTLLEEINEMLGGEALACAYTGKAASVMQKKGLPWASTVHQLIYTPTSGSKDRLNELKAELALLEKVDTPSKGLTMRKEALRRAITEATEQSKQPQFILKEGSAVQGAPLVILDECSMIPERMALDLLSFGVRLLVVGDPFQLPPVKGAGYFINGTPDDLLTEVHRQAANNPIISIATAIRNGRTPALGSYGDTRVVSRVTADEALGHEQVLCGTNRRRQAINWRHRELAGHFSKYPVAGERVVCLKNNHELGLLNGTLWDVTHDVVDPEDDGPIFLRVTPEGGGMPLGFPAEGIMFVDEEKKPHWGSDELFTWGYALTVHKSQGSQWNSVLMFDDWSQASSSYLNWLYTGVTRAAERLTLVR